MVTRDASDTEWIRSPLRLLFAGFIALTAYAYAKENWLVMCGALFVLGVVVALTLQVELHGWLSSPSYAYQPGLKQDTLFAAECRPGDIFESWMNEFPLQYDPDSFQWSLTRPVFVRLEGSSLTLWNTTAKVPRKALWNEAPLNETIPLTERRQYDLEGVRLLPQDISKSKLWNRKYPICVMVKTGSKSTPVNERVTSSEAPPLQRQRSSTPLKGTEVADGERESPASFEIPAGVSSVEEAEERLLEHLVSKEFISGITDEDDLPSDMVSTEAQMSSESDLILFARCSRQKEEWYHRLQQALRPSNALNDDVAFGEYIACLEPYIVNTYQGQGVNALIGRALYEATRSPRLQGTVKDAIQKRLVSLKMPVFMERLVVDDLSFGETFFEVLRTGSPSLDVTGLWVDMEVRYRGTFRIRLTTKLNLSHDRPSDDIRAEEEREQDGEDDVEWSARLRAPRNWPPFLKTLWESRYFNAALTALSNTNIVLSVEVQSMQGVLAVNLPPPPSDRLWLGFRRVPALKLEAVLRVGSRALRHSLVCRLVETKLRSNLERVFVLPNMQNILLSFMGENYL